MASKVVPVKNLDGIRRVTSELMPITVMVHGRPKVGKTWFAGTFPKPMLFAFVKGEQGTHTLTSAEFKEQEIYQVPIGSYTDLIDVLEKKLPAWIKEYGLKSFAIDTGTLLGSMLAIQEGEYGKVKVDYTGWNRIKGIFVHTRDTVISLGLHLVWVMHTVESKDDERIVHYEPQLVGKALNDIIPSCNILAYLTNERYEDPDTKKISLERLLWIRCPADAQPRFLAGTHFDEVFKEDYYFPSWDTLAKYLKGRVKDA